tara:strand:+ start:362 stop:697 length:336 start_codon:yes stop_codon:yes gene_type:complete
MDKDYGDFNLTAEIIFKEIKDTPNLERLKNFWTINHRNTEDDGDHYPSKEQTLNLRGLKKACPELYADMIRAFQMKAKEFPTESKNDLYREVSNLKDQIKILENKISSLKY